MSAQAITFCHKLWSYNFADQCHLHFTELENWPKLLNLIQSDPPMFVAKMNFVLENKNFPGNQQAGVGNMVRNLGHDRDAFSFKIAMADVSNWQPIFKLNGINAPPSLA